MTTVNTLPALTNSLQNIVLAVVDHADQVTGRCITLNPHLWRKEDIVATYQDPSSRDSKPWNSSWPVLGSFLSRHPDLVAEDLRLAYYGADNAIMRTSSFQRG